MNILASMSRDEDILHELEQELDNDTHLNSVNFFHFIRYYTGKLLFKYHTYHSNFTAS